MGNFLTDLTSAALTSDEPPFVGQQLIDNSDEVTVTLTSSSNPSFLGFSVTFTCNVTGVTPTGTVMFQVDGVASSTVTLPANTYSTTSLALGNHMIVAFYSGDSNNAPNSAVINPQTINVPVVEQGVFHGLSRVR